MPQRRSALDTHLITITDIGIEAINMDINAGNFLPPIYRLHKRLRLQAAVKILVGLFVSTIHDKPNQFITVMITWLLWRLKSPTSRLFVQRLTPKPSHYLVTCKFTQWCHNERGSLSNHQPVYSNIYSGADQRKHQSITGLGAGNSPVTGEFPAQRASKAENVPIWWRHHAGESPHKGPVIQKVFSCHGLLMPGLVHTFPFQHWEWDRAVIMHQI